jgi:hypothetical protein
MDKGRLILPLIAFAIGLVMLAVPLLRDVHVESAMVTTTLGCLLASCYFLRPHDTKGLSALLRIIALAGLVFVPLFVVNIIKGCITSDGLLFWLIYPVTGICFGSAVGTLVRSLNLRAPTLVLVGILIWLGLGVWLIEFFTLPQVRFYNHIWGSFPGPIYDEEVLFTAADTHFRLITMLWAASMWLFTIRKTKIWAPWLLLASVAMLVLSYTQIVQKGIITPNYHIQQKLGGHFQTEHFTIYYDTLGYSIYEIEQWALLHEAYRAHIIETLELDIDADMLHTESYLYRHVWQKKELTGAKYTSYVPVWNSIDQTHIAKEALEGTLHHELVHVAAKAFGNTLINASWSIGLIEGLAVAVAPDVSSSSTIDQIVAASDNRPDASTLEASLSIKGFYTGRGGVNYTTTGSFVRWLMREYPVDYIKEAYRSSRFDTYPIPFDQLVSGWSSTLDTISVDTTDRAISSRLFGRLSLFESDCPRLVTAMYKAYDRSLMAMMDHDTLQSALYMAQALKHEPRNERLWQETAIRLLMAGDATSVLEMDVDSVTVISFKKLYYADAAWMLGDSTQARYHLESLAQDSVGLRFRGAIERRSTTKSWDNIVALQYSDISNWPDPKELDPVGLSNLINRAGMIPDKNLFVDIQTWLPVADLAFNELERVSIWMILQNRQEEARYLIGHLSSRSLRQRETERLDLLISIHRYLSGRLE